MLKMNNPEVMIVLGKDLSKAELGTINYHRRVEFHSDSDIQPAPANEDWETPYFLVRDNQDQLMGFGRVLSLRVNFQGIEYPILGLASIQAIQKGKGYGRRIMEKMREYAQGQKKTAIGFCDPEDTEFYEKCGLGAIEGGISRFVFPGGPKSDRPGDIVYYEGEDRLIQRMMNYPAEKVKTSRPEW